MIAALELISLNKQFGTYLAVDRLDLSVPSGMLYALLGTNGAGKTTTLKMIAGLLKPDRGDALIFGHSIIQSATAAKQVLAYLPDDPMLYSKLRPLEYLEFIAGLWQVPPAQAKSRAQSLLQQLGLWDVRGDLTETFSRGMKQKLSLAGAFVHQPQLILLDEPLTGIDAASARLVKTMLSDYVQQGNTVILTTHLLDVAERMAQRIGILNHGQLIAEGTLDELRGRSGAVGGTLETVFLELIETPERSQQEAH
jgi:ABC-2 type transport system ATP-binding protein